MKPEFSYLLAAICDTEIPILAARWKSVSTGCQFSGSTRSSQLSALRILPPLRGTRTVYPNIPCAPGSSPVVNVVKAVVVVVGKVLCKGEKECIFEIVGSAFLYSSITDAPNPSIRKRHSLPLGLGEIPSGLRVPGRPRVEKIDGAMSAKCTVSSSH